MAHHVEDVYMFAYGDYDRACLRVINAFFPEYPATIAECREKMERVEYYFNRLVFKGNDHKVSIDTDVAELALVQTKLVERLAQLQSIDEGLGRLHPSLQTLMGKRLGASKYD